VGFEEADVVDDLDPAPVDVQDRSAHQVLVHHDPARLVHERRIQAARRRLHEHRIVFDLDDLVPRHELGGLVPAVVDEDPQRLGERLHVREDEIGHLADPVPDRPGHHGPLEQL
jgi:hypothetical protein